MSKRCACGKWAFESGLCRGCAAGSKTDGVPRNFAGLQPTNGNTTMLARMALYGQSQDEAGAADSMRANPSYEEVHGAMPRGPPVDARGLAQQVVSGPEDDATPIAQEDPEVVARELEEQAKIKQSIGNHSFTLEQLPAILREGTILAHGKAGGYDQSSGAGHWNEEYIVLQQGAASISDKGVLWGVSLSSQGQTFAEPQRLTLLAAKAKAGKLAQTPLKISPTLIGKRYNFLRWQ